MAFRNVIYWREDDHVQNMGDYLSELFVLRVAASPPIQYPCIRLVGSCIADFIIRNDLATCEASQDAAIGYWGCGMRDEQSIAADLLARCRFHGVRGPLTRDRLGLPADTPMGDPGLILPLIHTPRPAERTAGRAICVPHIADPSSTAALIARTGADDVLRPTVPRSIDALLELVDSICAADFVLAGALHAAIIACAYDRPFAYYDGNGVVDIPFKWFDFSASINVPTVFVGSVDSGRRAWQSLIAPSLRRPRLEPLLAVFPGQLQTGLLELGRERDALENRGGV